MLHGMSYIRHTVARAHTHCGRQDSSVKAALPTVASARSCKGIYKRAIAWDTLQWARPSCSMHHAFVQCSHASALEGREHDSSWYAHVCAAGRRCSSSIGVVLLQSWYRVLLGRVTSLTIPTSLVHGKHICILLPSCKDGMIHQAEG